jgi:hypothetical protein
MQDKQDHIRIRFDSDNRVVREDGGPLIYGAAPHSHVPKSIVSRAGQLRNHARKTGGMARERQRVLSAAIREVQREMHDERALALLQTDPNPDRPSQLLNALSEAPEISPMRRQRNHAIVLLRGFQVRRKLLEQAFTTKEVAGLLGGSRQMPLDRLKANRLVAARDAGDWRFPTWQFDPTGPDGVVDGLPAVLAAMPASNLQRIAWLSTTHPALAMAPIDALRAGQFDRVLHEAQAVGVS